MSNDVLAGLLREFKTLTTEVSSLRLSVNRNNTEMNSLKQSISSQNIRLQWLEERNSEESYSESTS